MKSKWDAAQYARANVESSKDEADELKTAKAM